MKKQLKIITVILTVVIAGGISAYYFMNVSQPWYTLTNDGNYMENISMDSTVMLYNETLIFGNEQSQLKFFDLSLDDPFVPTDILNLSVPTRNRFEIVDEILYTVDSSGFYIVNITNRVNHGIIGHFPMNHFSDEFILDGDLVYLTSTVSLLILNISVPSNITQLYERSLLFGPHGLSLHNNLLFIAETSVGVKIYNVTDPTSPLLFQHVSVYRGNYAVEGIEILEIFVTDDLLYVLDTINGLIIYNQTNLGKYYYVNSIFAMWGSRSFIIVDDLAYIWGRLGLKLIDISNPFNLHMVEEIVDIGEVFHSVTYESNPLILHEQGMSLYLLAPGVGPNPVRKEMAIEAITGFLQIIAYITLGIILVSIVKRSKIL